MSETARMWVEIAFNLGYLVVVWVLVARMVLRRAEVAPADRGVAARVTASFALLALGDTGHVGFRVIAYALGGLDARPVWLGIPISLVGIGALATAITVTLFYAVMLDAWRLRFGRSYGEFELALLGAGVARLLLMALPQNQWDLVVPPQPWSTLRNLPLILQGLGLAFLILRDARGAGDRTFGWIGVMILVSYACYIPVILFVQQSPLLGMLMIPKTLAYLGIAILAYRGLYARSSARSALALERAG